MQNYLNISGNPNLPVTRQDGEVSPAMWQRWRERGAFVSNFIVKSLDHRSAYVAHATPIVLEIVILLGVAVYGNDVYNGNDLQREAITGAVLFCMSLQNGLVSGISGGPDQDVPSHRFDH